MNPTNIVAANNVSTDFISDLQKPMKSAFVVLLVLAIIGLTWFFTKKIRERIKAQQFNDIDTAKDPKTALAKTYATRIYTSFNWYNDDEEAIYQVGKEMKTNKVSFNDVATAYKQGYGEDLAQRLSKTLNAKELSIFYREAGIY